jgi:hypothetical protein
MSLGGDHRDPLPGDGGIRFELKEGPEAAEAFATWKQVFGK